MADNKDVEASGSREKVLSSAEEVFAEHGYDGARVEEITSRAGVNVRMLYHHFGSKEGLFQAVCNRFDHAIIARLGKVFETETETETDTDAELVDLLARTVEEFWDFMEQSPNFVRIAAWCDLQHDRLPDLKHPAHDYVRNVLFPRMTELARQDGWASGADPAHVMIFCWSLPFFWKLNRKVCLTFFEGDDVEARDRAYRKFIITVLLDGLRGRPLEPECA